MHIDFAFWGFTLSIAAIILIVPLGILVNIITPKIQNWWASTSAKRLAARIEGLKKEINEPPTLLASVAKMIATVPLLVTGALLAVASQMVFTLVMADERYKSMRQEETRYMFVFICLVLLVSLFGSFFCFQGLRIMDRLKHGEERYQETYVNSKQEVLDKLLAKRHSSIRA